MPLIETNTRKIVMRLLRDRWVNVGGGKHEKYEHSERPEIMIIVPRHREQSLGVARSIARLAGWI
ncbi:type II toxin-antitoxin system HicA family toxin [Mesorhizobium sp. M0204]|uniref:type II toxin-antitoxin system HicA family toxin n=1 Tax=unclassified Mesorhizobium TaxID=325217 RepID=UPI00333D3A8B